MTDASRVIAGVILLTVVTIEFGGYFMTKIVRGQVPMTGFQKSFARAGHAHAGVLVIFSLVGLLYVDQTGLTGFWLWVGRLGIPVAAILMSGGFFASSAGKDRTAAEPVPLDPLARRAVAGGRRPDPRHRPDRCLGEPGERVREAFAGLGDECGGFRRRLVDGEGTEVCDRGYLRQQ